jgi:hypothetical protein
VIHLTAERAAIDGPAFDEAGKVGRNLAARAVDLMVDQQVPGAIVGWIASL